MADPRPTHYTMPTSVMNQPTPPYHGPARSLYGDRGPEQAHNTGRKPQDPPESIEHHITDAIARVAGLSPRQRLALRNELMRMTRDIGFLKLIHESARGPWTGAVLDSQGNAYKA
jgi:hypothetical protein